MLLEILGKALVVVVALASLGCLILAAIVGRKALIDARRKRLTSSATPTPGAKTSTDSPRCRYCGCAFDVHADDLD